MRVDWLRRASANVDEIKAFIAEDNPIAAAKMGQRIVEATERLVDFPHSGRPGRVFGTREVIVVGTPYIIAYRVADDAVQILRVLHGARQWPRSF